MLIVLQLVPEPAAGNGVASVPIEQLTLQHDQAQEQDDYVTNAARNALRCSCTSVSVVGILVTKGRSLAHSKV